jgi:hypothetical protein
MGIYQSFFSDKKGIPPSIKIKSLYIIISPESSSSNLSEKKCVICLEKESNYILNTCYHKCLCYDCAIKYSECPICREGYDYRVNLKKVYEP